MSSHRHLDGTASAQPSGSRSPQSTEDIHENVGHDTPDSVRGCALCHNASRKSAPETWTSSILPRFAKEG
ncbi:hypothetical protein BsWGS_09290 [Bradybaena similaris]